MDTQIARGAAVWAVAAVAAIAPTRVQAEGVGAGAYRVSILDASGGPLPTYEKNGRWYVLGSVGDRYRIRVRNDSWRRVEAVVSVDGLDAVDGKPASFAKRGYLVAPHDELVVDGFRVSMDDVATFRFSSVKNSYAVRTGSAREVGVVGVAIFPERMPPLPPPLVHRPCWDEPCAGPTPEEEMTQRDTNVGEPSQAAPRARSAAPPIASTPRSEDAGDAPRSRANAAERPGLGTEFGERRESRVTGVEFERASDEPAHVLMLRYDDRRGLAALGIDLDGCRRRDENRLRATARPFGEMSRRFANPPAGWDN